MHMLHMHSPLNRSIRNISALAHDTRSVPTDNLRPQTNSDNLRPRYYKNFTILVYIIN